MSIKLFSAIIFFFSFFFIQGFAQTGKTIAGTGSIEPGIYSTIDDFKNKKIKNVGVILGQNAGVVYFEKEGIRTKYKPKTFTDWGYRDNNGLSYRKYDDTFYTIITEGKIMVYSNNTFSKAGEEIKYEVGTIRISKSPQGELVKCSKKQLS